MSSEPKKSRADPIEVSQNLPTTSHDFDECMEQTEELAVLDMDTIASELCKISESINEGRKMEDERLSLLLERVQALQTSVDSISPKKHVATSNVCD